MGERIRDEGLEDSELSGGLWVKNVIRKRGQGEEKR